MLPITPWAHSIFILHCPYVMPYSLLLHRCDVVMNALKPRLTHKKHQIAILALAVSSAAIVAMPVASCCTAIDRPLCNVVLLFTVYFPLLC